MDTGKAKDLAKAIREEDEARAELAALADGGSVKKLLKAATRFCKARMMATGTYEMVKPPPPGPPTPPHPPHHRPVA